jgi:dGTPase
MSFASTSHVQPLLHTIAERERSLLAPFALHSEQSRGRRYAEPPHPYRGPFQRDRDRIVHSAAFRRLSGKTQVFTGEMGDYHRTRLTHTMEVASLARTIGRALGLNEDLIEALALFHDIGHPPFGHAGEDALHECLANEGGFSHNRFALTLVEELEVRCDEYPGLNLTCEVLDCQRTRVAKQEGGAGVWLEAQVVDAADSIAYNAHDTDDAVKLGLVTLDELAAIPLVGGLLRDIDRRHPAPSEKMRRKALVYSLLVEQVEDCLRTSISALADAGFRNAEEARQGSVAIGSGGPLAGDKRQLERFLYDRVYRHPRLVDVRSRAQQRLKELFEVLVDQPGRLPPAYQRRAEVVGIRRAAGDYLGSMTDRYCDRRYAELLPRKGGG